MKVTELTSRQLDILRVYYNYDANDSTALVDETDIPNSVLYAYYDGTEFVPGDFGEEEDTNDFWHITDEPNQLPALPQVITI